MEKRELLVKRLDEIGKSLEKTGDARALLGLGSAGVEVERLDNYSDLDFFVIAKDGKKKRFLDSLDWLTNISELAYSFLNTKDGYKVFFKDGVYCEFAIFEEYELKDIPFSKGKVVWKEDGFNEVICEPKGEKKPWVPHDFHWALNESLTCLYVGLCRYARGEKLSGTRFVQNFAVDILIASSSHMSEAQKGFVDEFQHERRYENRYPDIAKYLPKMIQGYDRVPESALEILKFIEERYEVNPHLKNEILTLANTLLKK